MAKRSRKSSRCVCHTKNGHRYCMKPTKGRKMVFCRRPR